MYITMYGGHRYCIKWGSAVSSFIAGSVDAAMDDDVPEQTNESDAYYLVALKVVSF